MNAAPAIAPVLIGNPVPQVGIPASAGSDETFGQMLRSVHEAGEAAASPGASDDPAMVLPRQVATQPSSGPPPAMAALLSNSSQRTTTPLYQNAVSFANAAHDGVGPAVATAPGLRMAATGAGAVPAAPLTPLPEAFPEVPVLPPQAVAISSAPETGASAFASPAGAAGLSTADDLVASSSARGTRLRPGAPPAKDAATPLTPKTNLHLPAGPTSVASAITATGSTSLPHEIPAQTVAEAHTTTSSLNAILTVPVVAVSKAAVSRLIAAALPRLAQSSPDVGTLAGQGSASSPRSTVPILAASTPAAQTPVLPAAVAPTSTLAAALEAASTLAGSLDSISPTSKSPATVGPASIGRSNVATTSVVPASAVRRTAVPAAVPATTSDETGAPGPIVVDIGMPTASPTRVDRIEAQTAAPMPSVGGGNSATVPVAVDGLFASGPALANLNVGLTAAVPNLAAAAMEAAAAIPASNALGRATAAAVPVREGGRVLPAAVSVVGNGSSAPAGSNIGVPALMPAAVPASSEVGNGMPAPPEASNGVSALMPATVSAPSGVGIGMPAPAVASNGVSGLMSAAVTASSAVTNQVRGSATVAASLGIDNEAPAAVSALSVVGNRVPGTAWASVDVDVPAAVSAPATTGTPPAPPVPAEAEPASAVAAEEMPAVPSPSVADIGVQAVPVPSVPSIGRPAPMPAPSAANIGLSPMPAPSVGDTEAPAPTLAPDFGISSIPAPSMANIGVSPRLAPSVVNIETPMPAPTASGFGMPSAMPAPSVSGIEVGPAPSAMAIRMPGTVAVRAAAGNELPATPLASALAMVATELPEAVPTIEPPSILRKPAPTFAGPSEADKLMVTEFDRNTRPVAFAVRSSSDLPPAPAADPGTPSPWAAASIPPSSLAPEAPPKSYQPPPWSQAPAPEAADLPVSTTELKSGLHAADPTADTAPRSADGETQIEQTASPNALSSSPATSGTVATDPAPPIKVGTHAAQIVPTLITLAKSALGSEQMTVRLHPAELGMVQVRIERAASGAAHIELTADDPKTLQALQRDQSALHRALDGAGIPAAGRTLTFHAVQQPSASVSSGSTGAASASGQHPSSGRGPNGNPDAARFSGGGRGSYSARQTTRRSGGRPSSANATTASTTPRVYRAGLDITA